MWETDRGKESGRGGIDFAQGEGWYRLWHIKGYFRLWTEEGIEAFTIKKVLCGFACVVSRKKSFTGWWKESREWQFYDYSLPHSSHYLTVKLGYNTTLCSPTACIQLHSTLLKKKTSKEKGIHSKLEWTVLNGLRCQIVIPPPFWRSSLKSFCAACTFLF